MIMVNFLQILKKEIRYFTFLIGSQISLKYFFSGVARLIVWQRCQPIWFRLRQEEKARKTRAKKQGLIWLNSFSTSFQTTTLAAELVTAKGGIVNCSNHGRN